MEEGPFFKEEIDLVNALVDHSDQIRERILSEAELQISYSFLEIAGLYSCMDNLLTQWVKQLRKSTSCAAVGIRILDREGNIPYQAYEGFSQEFIEKESPLSIHDNECTCVDVISGGAGGRLPYYTEGGSFFMNCTTCFLNNTSKKAKSRTCSICNQYGFETVVLIPIRVAGKRIIGLIHLADPDENKLCPRMIRILEKAATQFSTAIQRINAEEALLESKKQLQIIYDEMVDGVIMADATNKKCIRVNSAIRGMLGYSESELLAMTILDIHPPRQRDAAKSRFRALTDDRIRQEIPDIPLLRKDGSEFFADIGARIIVCDKRTCIISFYHDSTVRKQTEEELHQIAAGIAHEIRNPLQAITWGISLLETTTGDLDKEIFTGIKEESIRLNVILSDFLKFTKPYDPEFSVSNIKDLLDEIISLLREGNKYRDIKFVENLDPSIPGFFFDRDRIWQVIWNISLNSLEAIGYRGVLKIRTVKQEGYVLIEITDNGRGILPEQLTHIFEPFYTSRKEGTGIGLYIASRIVKGHGGRIEVKSNPGEGTTFSVFLPLRERSD